MNRDQLIFEITNLLSQMAINYEIGNGTDVHIGFDFTDADWNTEKKVITYEASILVNEMTQTVFMWEKTVRHGHESGNKFDDETSFQSSTSLYRNIKFMHRNLDGSENAVFLDLTAVNNEVKEAAEQFGWKFENVQERKNAEHFVNTPQNENPGVTFCASCGKIVNPGSKFCSFCGTPTVDSSIQNQQSPFYSQNVQAEPPYVQTDIPQQTHVQQQQQYSQNSTNIPVQKDFKKSSSAIILIPIAVVILAIIIGGFFLIKNILSNAADNTDDSSVTTDIQITSQPTPIGDSSVVSEGVSTEDLGNIMNGQYYFNAGDYIYYSSFDSGANAHIYRTNSTGGASDIIFNGFGWSLVVIDDWLYFSGNQGTAIDNTYNLFRMRADGSDLQNLNSGYCFGMFIYQNYLYYMKQTYPDSGEYSFYRANLDGTSEMVVASDCYNAVILDNMLYYNDYYGNIYIANPDGSNPIIIVSDIANNFVIGNGKIIFTDISNNLYVCDIDGSNESLIRYAGSYSVSKINTFGDKIFFVEYDETFDEDYYGYYYWISSINFDGSGEIYIYGSVSYGTYLNVIDNKVYVMDYAVDLATGYMPAIARRMNFDGSNVEDLPR